LPEDYRSDLGISADLQDLLTQMNDSRGWSFSEIADWIDKNIPAE